MSYSKSPKFHGKIVWTPEKGWHDGPSTRESTTCGHPVPAWHETTWGTDGQVFCSLACMAASMERDES